MEIFEVNKQDLVRRNRELRHKQMEKERLNKIKMKEREEKQKVAAEAKANNPNRTYPPLILTMMKRLKRIDPWNTVAGMHHYQSALVTYYKLKQFGMEKLRISANNQHAWCEFDFDGIWWVFDPIAVRIMKLGSPVKKHSECIEQEYIILTRSYTDINDYIETFDEFINITKDEAKIIAMEDEGLLTVLKHISYK